MFNNNNWFVSRGNRSGMQKFRSRGTWNTWAHPAQSDSSFPANDDVTSTLRFPTSHSHGFRVSQDIFR
jgi:hypothetical protein